MRKTLTALSLLFLTSLPALGDDRVVIQRWYSDPPATAFVSDSLGERHILCYSVLYRESADDTTIYYRGVECPGEAADLSSIAVPVNEPVINMENIPEARHFRWDSGGNLVLY